MSVASLDRLGEARLAFDCCDTEFVVDCSGVRARAAAERARDRARSLETRLNAFAPTSAVARLNREGRVVDEHVARLVRRGLEYRDRTDGAFDVRHGAAEHRLKEYIRGDADDVSVAFDGATVSVDGDEVCATAPLDLNGLAKGYIVDRAAAELDGFARDGFVDGGGDISPPTGPVGIENPDGGADLRIVETDWSIASSGSYRRRRSGVDHIYRPAERDVGAASELVTVLARRDCTEADALATTLAALPPSEALDLAESWNGLEAFFLRDGVFCETTGFADHVHGGSD